ncbi:MAG TPA: biotin/lipoyl-containing protein [Vicinamibacterales bacterium]|nr:biotin/lipoyl-containing protein [Vicinamibacterales bacterium]
MPITLLHNDRAFVVDLLPDGRVRVDGATIDASAVSSGRLMVDGRPAWIARDGDARWVFYEGRSYVLTERRAAVRRRGVQHDAALSAPMPATVRRILVRENDRVKAGETLIVLEAMKMELPIRATAAGVIRALHCAEGELVPAGVPLVAVDEGMP